MAQDDARQLIGAWRLVEFSGDDYAMSTRGPRPSGLVIYHPTGAMSLQIMPDVAIRQAFASKEPTPDEAKRAFTGYQAYFGTYSVDVAAQTVTHHLEGNLDPGQIDSRTRSYEFAGPNRLVLRINTRALTWERLT